MIERWRTNKPSCSSTVSAASATGSCSFCSSAIHGRIRFAPLQGELARTVLPRHGLNPDDLDSVVVISRWQQPSERALTRAAAVLYTLDVLGRGWRVLARVARVVPGPLANWLYDLVARIRYKVFGRFEACQLPRPEWRERFFE